MVDGHLKFDSLKLVQGQNPARTYMVGQIAGTRQWKLVVEISAARSADHHRIMEKILVEVREGQLTKQDAHNLREQYAPKGVLP